MPRVRCEKQLAFLDAPYPQFGETFVRYCTVCGTETAYKRVLTRKTAAELRAAERERALRQSIADRCAELGFRCRFLYQSVIAMTPLSDWCFDYHERKITLYHESTVKINFVCNRRLRKSAYAVSRTQNDAFGGALLYRCA